MRKTVPGASIKMAIAVAVLRSAGTQHCNNAWPTDLGVAAVHRVRTRPRRNHPRQLDPGGAKATRAQRLRQLRDIHRDPPRLVFGEFRRDCTVYMVTVNRAHKGSKLTPARQADEAVGNPQTSGHRSILRLEVAVAHRGIGHNEQVGSILWP